MNQVTLNHATLVAHQNRLKQALERLQAPTDVMYDPRESTIRALQKAVEDVDGWLTDYERQVKR